MSVEVDDSAFLAALSPAFEEWRSLVHAVADVTADKVVETAKALVPKRSGRLAESIDRGPVVVTSPNSAYVEVHAGGPGIRETIFVEFGTAKMRAEPYMRPALALAAGAARGAGFAARVATTSKTRAAVKRAVHRQKLRRAVKAGLLTRKEALRASQRISSSRRFRG